MTCARRIVLLSLLVLAASASAQEAASAPDRRAQIARERAAIEQQYTERQQACRERFVVTSCLDEAREQRRAALAPLRQEELRIDTEERKQRAAARLAEIEAKQRADASRDAASAPREPRAVPPQPSQPAPRIFGGTPKAPLPADERARREAESEAKFERKQQEAARHRAEVEARNAERAAKGKAAPPLPVPSGASAP